MNQDPITIVLADDHRVVREGLRALLEAEPDFSVVAEAADGLQAAEMTERLKPGVLVLDLLLPGLNGLDVLRRVVKRVPKTRVVVLSMHATEAHVIAALKHGASSYVTKDASSAELSGAIRKAAAGQRHLSAPFSSAAVDAYLRQIVGTDPDPYEKLTSREREVLHLAAEGLSSSQIADRLNISPRTAETHRANAMKKLNLHGQTGLVLYAVERGLLPSKAPSLDGGESGPPKPN
ncbi:MAG TPA: response regulator transcription factor [Candidatus Limnocylindrales bacterium]|nr:response regulator transcription factor [Candidatus Limnocylindrales bacterium]